MLEIAFMYKGEENAFSWHVGDKNPFDGGLLKGISISNVIQVDVDGDELFYVRERFKNLPDAPFNRIISWFGDDAKFIAHHLGRS